MEWCGKRSDFSGLQEDKEVGNERALFGTTLPTDILEQRPALVASKERLCIKCKSILVKVIVHVS